MLCFWFLKRPGDCLQDLQYARVFLVLGLPKLDFRQPDSYAATSATQDGISILICRPREQEICGDMLFVALVSRNH